MFLFFIFQYQVSTPVEVASPQVMMTAKANQEAYNPSDSLYGFNLAKKCHWRPKGGMGPLRQVVVGELSAPFYESYFYNYQVFNFILNFLKIFKF